jgi:hypothetical protein
MMKTAWILLAAALAGCATPASPPPGTITPEQAVLMAAASAPRGVRAVVALQVMAVGRQNGITYLNSQADYRDQRNVSIAIRPEVLREVETKFGGPLDQTAYGKRLRVEGAAERVTIWFLGEDGRPSDKYYYQTHIRIVNAAQLQLI